MLEAIAVVVNALQVDEAAPEVVRGCPLHPREVLEFETDGATGIGRVYVVCRQCERAALLPTARSLLGRRTVTLPAPRSRNRGQRLR